MPFRGLEVALVAKFNTGYHRSGLGLAAGLERLGCRVSRVDLRTRGLDALLRRTLAGRLRQAARSADLVLGYKAGELEPDLIADVRRNSKALWVNWFPDSPHLLDLSLRIAAGYDRCFLFDSYMVERHRAVGHNAEFLPLGFDPDFYRPLATPGAATVPLVFVGSAEPLRDAVLETVADLGLELWGPDRARGALFGDALVRTYSRAKVALNIHQFFGEPPERGRYGTGANQRVFELAGIGVAQLCDAKADIARSFVEDREIVLFRTKDECREKARALLADDAWRLRVGADARTRALAEHTWERRLEELLTRSLR